MERVTVKEKIGLFIGTIVFVIIIGVVIYDKFFYEPKPPKYLSSQEQRQLEQRLIEQYGSLENAENVYREQNDPGNGVGHPLWDN